MYVHMQREKKGVNENLCTYPPRDNYASRGWGAKSKRHLCQKKGPIIPRYIINKYVTVQIKRGQASKKSILRF
jgi:hypothetical protein